MVRAAARERDRQRQAHVSKSNHGDNFHKAPFESVLISCVSRFYERLLLCRLRSINECHADRSYSRVFGENVMPLLRILLLLLVAGCSRHRDEASLMKEAHAYAARGDAKAAVIQLKNVLQQTPSHGHIGG
jgi:hypothetical protein